MGRPRRFPPPIYTDKRTNTDRVRVYDPDGRPRMLTLGPAGSDEARAEYLRVIGDLEAARAEHAERIRTAAKLSRDGEPLAVVQLIDAYLAKSIEPRVAAGKLSATQAERYRRALRVLRELYAATPAAEFTVRRLDRLREHLLTHLVCPHCAPPRAKAPCKRCRERPQLTRAYTNSLVDCVRRLFRWAAEKEMAPAGVWHSLSSLRALGADDALGRDSGEVTPAPEASVAAVEPHLRPQLRAVLRLQVLTGARPNELLGLRPADIDRSGRVEVAPGQWVDAGRAWAARPAKHKNSWRGARHRRLILLGPAAQEVLAPFLQGRAADAYLFSPAEAVAGLRAERAASRKTPEGQGNRAGTNRKTAPRRTPAARYTPQSYRQAVARACAKAGVPVFTPYQLRHLAAAKLFEEFGDWDLVRTVLGHKTLDATRIYAPDRIAKAAEAVGQSG